eukprot:COSAG03_NODE_16971_length_387_cov_0.885417_1_plen_21_part_01
MLWSNAEQMILRASTQQIHGR